MSTIEPESLLSATRKTASVAKLPWPHVQKVYQALQAEGLAFRLPKSKGRDIQAARPGLIAILLVALAGSDTASGAGRAVETFVPASENGSGSNHLGDALAQALASEAAADDIESVEFHTDTFRACINSKSRGQVWFWMEVEEVQPDLSVKPVPAPEQARIRFRGVIDGELFRLLNQVIEWGSAGGAA